MLLFPEFPFCCISNLWFLRGATTKVALNGCERCRYVGWSSSTVGITGTKEMYSVSVSGSKVLRLLVIDLHWKYLSRPVLNGRTRRFGAC